MKNTKLQKNRNLTSSPAHKLTSSSAGFSLIELIVAVSIMIIISSVALFNQAKFSSDILISNMAYEVALTIRQAQVYGTSSKGDPNAPTNLDSEKYRVGYGVHFDGDNTGTKSEKFFTFIDVPAQGGATDNSGNTQFNYEFDPPSLEFSDEYKDFVTYDIDLTQGQKIHGFCVHTSGVGWNNCWDSTSTENKSLDIVFVKPDPDAHITFWDGNAFSGNIPSGVKYDRAKIVIESGLGDKCRAVTVYASGQVSVDAIDPNIPNGGCGIDWATLQ